MIIYYLIMLKKKISRRCFQIRSYCSKTIKYADFEGVGHVKSFESIPKFPSLPMLGNWHLYKLGIYKVEKYHQVLCNMRKKYGPIVKEQIGWESPIVHVFDVEDAEIVYRNEGKIPHIFPLLETSNFIRHEIDFMSPGLGFTNGDEWYKLRNGVRSLMMKARSMQQYLPYLNVITNDLIQTVKENQKSDYTVENLSTLIGLWSQECSGAICFDRRLGYLRGQNEELGKRIIEANKTLFQLSALLKFSLPFYKYFKTQKWSKLNESEHFIYGTANKYLEEALACIELEIKNETLKNGQFSFLTGLLNKNELTRKDITVITISLFVDGLSTVVPTMLHNLYALAVNEKVQEKLHEGICKIVKKSDLTPEIIDELTYLKAVVKETFRLYPNGTDISRINQKPLVLSGYYIPSQTKISMNMIVNFRLEKYFADPEIFKPERWLRGNETDNANPLILRPFGHGARTCTGRKFSELVLYTSLVKILQLFHLSYSKDALPLDDVYHSLIFPDKELPIKFTPR